MLKPNCDVVNSVMDSAESSRLDAATNHRRGIESFPGYDFTFVASICSSW
jgi:hypothetical protein